jgi:hypothetical protein
MTAPTRASAAAPESSEPTPAPVSSEPTPAPVSSAPAAPAAEPAAQARSERHNPLDKARAKAAETAKLLGRTKSLEVKVDRLTELAEVERAVAERRPARSGQPTFEDLALEIPQSRCGFLDREDLDETTLDADQLFFRRNGYLIKDGFIPPELTEPYLADRINFPDPNLSIWGGSYMAIPSMRDVCLYRPLVDLIERLVGEPVGLFLTLSGLESTRRTWHQDFYLKPGYENVNYCAAWIAVGDVDPDSGPYQFVPGTHRLPSMRQELVWEWLTPEERVSPASYRIAETFVTDACAKMFVERELEPQFFVPKRGDLLIWHHSLLHQGSRARRPDLMRPGLISHYNSLAKQRQMGREMVQHPNGSWYRVRDDYEVIVPNQIEATEFKLQSIAARSQR